MNRPLEPAEPTAHESLSPGEIYGYGQTPLVMMRAAIGGGLMGLAKAVPGIGGATMLLASGVYPFFMRALAEMSALRFRRSSLALVLVTLGAALATAWLLAGAVHAALVEYRHVVYGLFTGLTLGGIPVVWGMARPASPAVFVGGALGFVAMAALALAQLLGLGEGAVREGVWLYFVAGVLGGGASVLPGISGVYALLVMGVYLPVLASLDHLASALVSGTWDRVVEEVLLVLAPLVAGGAIGIGVVSRVFGAALRRHEKLTLGILLGFLLGTVVGLYPFQRGVAPSTGQLHRGHLVTSESASAIPAYDYPTELFAPGVADVMAVLCALFGGFFLTALVAKFGRKGESGLSATEHEGDPETDHPA